MYQDVQTERFRCNGRQQVRARPRFAEPIVPLKYVSDPSLVPQLLGNGHTSDFYAQNGKTNVDVRMCKTNEMSNLHSEDVDVRLLRTEKVGTAPC